MKFRCGLLAILLLGSSTMVYAGNGIKRSEWSFRPEITTDNLVLGMTGMAGGGILEGVLYGDEESPWWFPLVTYRGNSGISMHEEYTYYIRNKPYTQKMRYEDKTRLVDFKNIGYSIGGSITYMSKELPVGFWIKLAYERQVYGIKGETGVKGHMSSDGDWIYDGSSDARYTSHIGELIGDNLTLSKQMLVPEAGIKFRFGRYRTAEEIFTIDLGARYDMALDSKGLYSGKGAVNSGITGIFGFAWGRPDKHFQVGCDYEMPFYDYFNKDFSPSSGYSKPFKNLSFDWFRFGMSIYVRRGF